MSRPKGSRNLKHKSDAVTTETKPEVSKEEAVKQAFKDTPTAETHTA